MVTGPDPAAESTSAQLRRVEGELGSALSRLRVLEKRCADLEAAEAERDQAKTLLEYAIHLRQHGERAPGGNETWAEFDQRTDHFLRGLS